MSINRESISQAAHRIAPFIRRTPVIDVLLPGLTNPVTLKLELLQHTGSFKPRGALNKIANLTTEERKNGERTTHYVSEDGDEEAAAAGLTHGNTNLWLARDGGYLVGLAIEGTWALDETPTPISLTIDVTNVNDPANRISPPG